MRLLRLFTLTLACFVLTANAFAQSQDDALALLDSVVKRYDEAESVHLEATVVNVSHNEYDDSTQRSVLSSYTASGGRFLYSGKNYSGEGVLVSDGASEWYYMHGFNQYIKQPAGTFAASHMILTGDAGAVFNARDLLRGITSLDANINSVHFLPSETLQLNGYAVQCTVVHYDDADSTGKPRSDGETRQTTVWIDAASLTVLKLQYSLRNKFWAGGQKQPFGRYLDTTITTTYTTTELNFNPAPDIFAFAAPADSQQIDKLPKGMSALDNKSGSDREEAKKKHADTFVGKQLPDVTLVNAEGKRVPSTEFKGHPLLIDVWATWCGPCQEELPAIQKIRQSSKQTDLAIVGIDEDYKTADSVQFLKRRGYDWPDYHYSHELVTQWGVNGIPLLILVDAEGRIVYYHSGDEDSKGLIAAITALGDAYKGVTAQ